MKKYLVILIFWGMALALVAQTPNNIPLNDILREWNTEYLLDSLDQERQPRIVSGGIIAGSNISNFIIRSEQTLISSRMKIGWQLGGFLNFKVTNHFVIEGQLLLTSEQNRFKEGEENNLLWSFGMEMPVYFMGKYGNMGKGYLQFGAGPFSHFTFASNIKGAYNNNDAVPQEAEPEKTQPQYGLHGNHSGLAATIGYEFPIGIQLNAYYMVSLSDIFTYYQENKGDMNPGVYPQRVALCLGYRWK